MIGAKTPAFRPGVERLVKANVRASGASAVEVFGLFQVLGAYFPYLVKAPAAVADTRHRQSHDVLVAPGKLEMKPTVVEHTEHLLARVAEPLPIEISDGTASISEFGWTEGHGPASYPPVGGLS